MKSVEKKPEEKVFRSLEEMRDELTIRTRNLQSKDQSSDLNASKQKQQVSVQPPSAPSEQEPMKDISKESSANESSKTKERNKVIDDFEGSSASSNDQGIDPATSREKFHQFMTQGTSNIYSDSEGIRGPSVFSTTEFRHRVNPEQLKAFHEMTITDTQVQQFQKFKLQRLKKAASFALQRENISNTKVRPMFSDDSSSDDEKEDLQDPLISIENENDLEYRSTEDAEQVDGYIKRFGRQARWTAIGLGIAAVLLTGWQLLISWSLSLPLELTMERPIVYLSIHLAVLIGIGAACWDVVSSGISGLFARQANRDSAAAIMLAGCAIQTLALFASGRMLAADSNVFLLTPVAAGGMCFHYIAKCMLARRAKVNFDLLSDQEREHYAAGIIANEDLASAFTRGRVQHKPVVAFNRKAKFLTDFMYYSFLEDLSDRVGSFLAPIGLCVSMILAGIAAVAYGNFETCVTAFAAGVCVVSAFSFLLSVNLPLSAAQKKLREKQGALLGYEAAVEFNELNAVITSAHALFPKGSVCLHGMRMFHGHPIDDSILNAASILHASNSILRDMFMEVLQDHKGYLRKVDSILFEDGMGISGWVDDRRVIVGSAEMMVHHSVDLPAQEELDKLKQSGSDVIYISVSGQLAAAFIFSVQADENVLASLQQLEAQSIILVAQTVDPVITAEKMADVFGFDPEMFKILPARYHKAYRKQVRPVERAGSAVINNGTFSSYVQSVVASKKLRTNTLLSMILSLTGVFLAVLMLIICILSDSFGQLSATWLLVYQLLCAGVVSIVGALRAG